MVKKLKFDNSYREIAQKGTIALVTTLGSGLLFGKNNMMIAFVLVLGAGALAVQNLRVKTCQKTLRLIGIDILLVCLAFIASLNGYWAIPINLFTLFMLIYVTVSPYNQITYKTFMMLFVFCQYSQIPLEDLPKRLLMVACVVTIVVLTGYLDQSRYKALLPPQIHHGFRLLHEQLMQMIEGKFDEDLSEKLSEQMGELAYVIYHTSYKRYFTTYIGKVHFHFYLNMSYFNLILEQIYEQMHRGYFTKQNLMALKGLFDPIEAYFERRLKREELIKNFDEYIEANEASSGFNEEVYEVIYALRKNFMELEEIPYHKKNQLYNDWGRSDLSRIRNKIRGKLNPKSMSFNFAMRMAVVISVLLFLAFKLGFYKFIWAIIPVMSITQPYYEDTRRRGSDRVKSNILAAIALTLIVDIVKMEWIVFALLVIAFYLIYAYKDYYHMSLFLTIISMSVSSFGTGMNTLVFYRIIYVLLGAGIVLTTSKLMPYRLEDGIEEMITEIEHLNEVLEKESLLSLEGKANRNRIREAIIYSAVLSQKLSMKNKQRHSERVQYLLTTNTEFAVRLGHCVLRNN